MASNSKPTLWIVGVPLADKEAITESAKAAIALGTLWIGESRRRTDWALRQSGVPMSESVFFLDPLPPPQEKALKEAIKKAASQNGSLVLLSDTGMPVLFDPGGWILSRCRELGFQIRSASGPTSWSTACVISGWEPPFWVEGFLPRETSERATRWKKLSQVPANIVLLDTPYRFEKLVEECSKELPPGREIFLAWEIGSPNELYFWGDALALKKFAAERNLTKGEFILMLKSADK